MRRRVARALHLHLEPKASGERFHLERERLRSAALELGDDLHRAADGAHVKVFGRRHLRFRTRMLRPFVRGRYFLTSAVSDALNAFACFFSSGPLTRRMIFELCPLASGRPGSLPMRFPLCREVHLNCVVIFSASLTSIGHNFLPCAPDVMSRSLFRDSPHGAEVVAQIWRNC